jgi:hypothetical protein
MHVTAQVRRGICRTLGEMLEHGELHAGKSEPLELRIQPGEQRSAGATHEVPDAQPLFAGWRGAARRGHDRFAAWGAA